MFYLFIYLFVALGLGCNAQAFSSCGERGPLFVVVRGLLITVASLVAKHGLSSPAACGIFPDQGLNLCPVHWQVESKPLCHQGSPQNVFLKTSFVLVEILA